MYLIAMLTVDEAKVEGPFGRWQRPISLFTTFFYQFQYYITISTIIYSIFTGWWQFLAAMGVIMLLTIPLKRSQLFVTIVSKYLMPSKYFDKFEIIYEEVIPDE